MSDVPREPSYYHPTTHAKVQQKDRNIPWESVAETIKDGTMKKCHKPDCKLFIKEFERFSDPVGVVASYETGEIVTVEWRYKHD